MPVPVLAVSTTPEGARDVRLYAIDLTNPRGSLITMATHEERSRSNHGIGMRTERVAPQGLMPRIRVPSIVDGYCPQDMWALAILLQPTGTSSAMHLDLLQGTLDLLILQTLRHGPRHGYGIASFIADASNGTFRVLDGALYASLHRLERTGLVVAVWGTSDRGRRARFYELTGPGRAAAREEIRRWQRYSTGVARVIVAGRGTADRAAAGGQESTGDWAEPGADSASEFNPGYANAKPFSEDLDE